MEKEKLSLGISDLEEGEVMFYSVGWQDDTSDNSMTAPVTLPTNFNVNFR